VYQHLYQHFLKHSCYSLHFAAHSHHYWPDVTRDAMIQYWEDSARMVDGKWAHIFGNVIPRAQRHIAKTLNLSQPEQITFAPNTHEFVTRIFSCFQNHANFRSKPVHVLTTDSEFHSFNRQLLRWEEVGLAQSTRISTEPFETFEERFLEAARSIPSDLIFLSQVFFNSGFAIQDLESFVSKLPDDTPLVIDGYHGFCAIPTSLKKIENRAFYLGGGYKYAQAGEGVGFLYTPPSFKENPVDTGWFASFEELEHTTQKKASVPFGKGALKFWGSTFDPTGLYRFNAVWDHFEKEAITIETVDRYVKTLQTQFLTLLYEIKHPDLNTENLLTPVADPQYAHFLTFKTDRAETISQTLKKEGILVDHRADRLRIGFGLYQTMDDVHEFSKTLSDKL
jgi:selenocysteine lyase/cysteine desulfurase